MGFVRRGPFILLVVLFCLAAGRFAWICARSPTGWPWSPPTWWTLVKSTVGSGGISRPIGSEDPPVQARYWMDEVSRVKGTTTDPRIAMGAAWVLDSPQSNFVSRHRNSGKPRDPFDLRPATPDWGKINQLLEEFDAQCSDTCLALAAKAVELDPQDVELWRSRGQLLFPQHLYGANTNPRAENWQEILKECRQHDPDNALYDYLAAQQLWTTSATYDVKDDGYTLNVTDQSRFDEGVVCFEQGLKKPLLAFGERGFADSLAFIELTSVQPMAGLETAESRSVSDRSTLLVLRGLLRWNTAFADESRRHQDFDAAAATLNDMDQLATQLAAGQQFGLEMIRSTIQSWTEARQFDLRKRDPQRANAELDQQYQISRRERGLERAVTTEVSNRLHKRGKTARELRPVLLLLPAAAAAIYDVMTLTLVLLLASALIWFVFRRERELSPLQIRWWQIMIAWGLGIAVSAGLFLYASSTIATSTDRQTGGFVWLADDSYPFAEILKQPTVSQYKWIGGLSRWLRIGGTVALPVTAIVLLAAWCGTRLIRSTDGGIKEILRHKKGALMRESAVLMIRATLVPFLITGTIFFACAPAIMAKKDADYRLRRTRLIDPAAWQAEFETERRAVRADQATMARLVEENTRRYDSLEKQDAATAPQN